MDSKLLFATTEDVPLAERLADPSRPVFLLGEVPPGEGTPPGKCLEICTKFSNRSQALASDGFIVYDIQDEPGRFDTPRPFPFRRLMDSSPYAALLARTSGKQCLVYKCVADEAFDGWIETACRDHGHGAINVVGRATSDPSEIYKGPTIGEAMAKVQAAPLLKFGCVCIGERHTLEAATSRGKSYPTEHLNMLRKQTAGAEWFVSQAIYDVQPTIRLLKDYASLCRQHGVVPRKVILTFAPVSRVKTLNFIKWLGVKVPAETEESILQAERPVDQSISILCDHLRTILQECSGIGVPLGINCESVSIYKEEIDGVHELFRRLQRILLDARGSPWKVVWVDSIESKTRLPPTSTNRSIVSSRHNNDDDDDMAKTPSSGIISPSMSPESALIIGLIIGGTLVLAGVAGGSSSKSRVA